MHNFITLFLLLNKRDFIHKRVEGQQTSRSGFRCKNNAACDSLPNQVGWERGVSLVVEKPSL